MEPFSMSPVDKVPVKGTGYKNKELDKWSWLNFYDYFIAEYNEKVGDPLWISGKAKGAKKKIIEQSMAYRSNLVLKTMIDWLLGHYQDYPEWKEPTIGLVLGNHGWAKMIAEKAEKKLELDRHRS